MGANCFRAQHAPGENALRPISSHAFLSRLFNPSNSRPVTPQMDVDLRTVPPRPEQECPICMDTLSEEVVETQCGHHFHERCLMTYVLSYARQPGGASARCPLCRGLMRVPMPVEATSSSGRPIEVTSMPERGSRCHFDRRYQFLSLGEFESKPTGSLLYVCTSNEDRKTPSDRVMWTLTISAPPVTVYLNFRSEEHVECSEATPWLSRDGWQREALQGSTSSGQIRDRMIEFNGPVFSKLIQTSSQLELMGSNTWQGTYFVFIELGDTRRDTRVSDYTSSDEETNQ